MFLVYRWVKYDGIINNSNMLYFKEPNILLTTYTGMSKYPVNYKDIFSEIYSADNILHMINARLDCLFCKILVILLAITSI